MKQSMRRQANRSVTFFDPAVIRLPWPTPPICLLQDPLFLDSIHGSGLRGLPDTFFAGSVPIRGPCQVPL